VRLVEAQDWLGNFRELNNFVTRLAVECLDDSIILEDSVTRVLSERIRPAISIEVAQPSMRAASGIIRPDYQSSEEDDLITVTFDPKFDDLDAVYLKAAGKRYTSRPGGKRRQSPPRGEQARRDALDADAHPSEIRFDLRHG
jgi:DNA-binding NtrC family response regulator